MNRISDLLAAKLPFFYGYVALFVAVVAQIGSSPGQTYAISTFNPYLQADLGLSKSELSAAYMLGSLMAAIPLMAIGPLLDRVGIRRTGLGVVIGLAATCFLASQTMGFLSILVTFTLLRFLGQGALTLLSGNMVSMWFQQQLGSMNAIMCGSTAVAFAVVPLALHQAIESLGWRTAFVIQGGLLLVGLVPLLAILYRNHPADVSQQLDGRGPARPKTVSGPQLSSDLVDFTLGQAARQPAFWILGVGIATWAMIGTGIIFHVLDVFEQFGIPNSQVQLLFPTFSISMLVAQLTGGVLADRTPMHRLLAVAFGLLAAGAAAVPLTTGPLMVHVFALCFGAGQGLAMSVVSTMWARYFGRKHLGKIRGAVWCATVAGSGCGPLILGAVADTTGSFTPGLWCFVAMLAPLAPLMLLAKNPQAKLQPLR